MVKKCLITTYLIEGAVLVDEAEWIRTLALVINTNRKEACPTAAIEDIAVDVDEADVEDVAPKMTSRVHFDGLDRSSSNRLVR